jgi:hypothetical protein
MCYAALEKYGLNLTSDAITYSGFVSNPIYSLPSIIATSPVVAVPLKQSITLSPSLEDNNIHNAGIDNGKVAE